MNRREERQLFEEVHENKIMLHQICDVINIHLARFHQENEDDFNRNVLANLISSGINFDKLGRR